eukprot:2276892-Amphidinium_carterae.3
MVALGCALGYNAKVRKPMDTKIGSCDTYGWFGHRFWNNCFMLLLDGGAIQKGHHMSQTQTKIVKCCFIKQQALQQNNTAASKI